MTFSLYAALFAFLAGVAAFLGAVSAKFENIKPNWLESEVRHGIMAFGGGALIAAVALVLVPEGMAMQPNWLAFVTFLMGAMCFMGIDRLLAKSGRPFSQWLAMMLDFVPEAIVLGAVIEDDFRKAVFMAIIIAAQNFPEGFNVYREMVNSHSPKIKKNVFMFMGMAVVCGPLFALLGYYSFSPHSAGLGALMTFCAGGILYLVFQDIAPQAKMKKHWLPPLGAVLGFMVGMIGQAWV
jgi:ZIP family zinc transporter